MALDYRRAAGLLRVDVTDTGIGIPPGRVDLLFERFSQADTSITRRFGGTGLGLAICKRLVVLMGGRIGAEGLAQGGSNFYFEVPLRAIDEPDIPETASTPTRSSTIGGRLLLAEDNAVNAEIIAAMLSGRGYVVDVVGDGAAAVELTARDPTPDLVLMDLHMPDRNGLHSGPGSRTEGAASADHRPHRECPGRGRDAVPDGGHGRSRG